MIKKLHLEIVRLVLGLAADLAMALVVEGLTLLSQGADALVDRLEREDDDADEPAADELLTSLEMILMSGAQVSYDPQLARPWCLLLRTQEIASARSLVDLVLQARAHRGSR